MTKQTPIGRFAPSPTGPLHMGSLLSALASYLDIKSIGGQWLVRMEDLDPPREMPGADTLILEGLEAHGLHSDGEVLFQSQRHHIYQEYVERCFEINKAFYCVCSRQDIAPYKGIYPGTCRNVLTAPTEPHAVRLVVEPRGETEFTDLFQGTVRQDVKATVSDYVIRRKDLLYAYQLAVVVDDGLQDITHIIRGVDLIDSTLQQIYLQQVLGFQTPIYGHVLLVMNEFGQKLSKRAHSPAMINTDSRNNLVTALELLQQSPPEELRSASNEEILTWGVENWKRETLYGKKEIYP